MQYLSPVDVQNHISFGVLSNDGVADVIMLSAFNVDCFHN